ncbi:MAG: DUF1552 domain-containing protein [Verrucomicrobia bacterium]|nr:DUF1552 domain-containing protein [Verrucomicrobiota bacterium]
MTAHLSRRRFVIRSLSASLTLPWLPSLMADSIGNDAAVQTSKGAGDGARRFVAIGNLLGFQQKSFFPNTIGKDYDSPPLLKPLSANRPQMTIFRGLDHGIKGGHFAVHTFLSGVLHHQAQDMPEGNVTIDQFIADELGVQTRFPSLTVGSEGGIHGGCQIAWTRSGVRVPPITGPAELFDKLFVTDSNEIQAKKIRQNRVQGSILDAVLEDANRLSSRVNLEDRDKLDEYFTSVRDVEKRLELRERWTDQPKPDAPFSKPTNKNTVNDLPLLYELMALALQTDSTRVATLEIGGSFLPQHLGIERSYHSMSHHGNDPDTVANLITLETYQIEQFGKFLTRLSGMIEGDHALLDSTSVLFGSGMGNGHSHTNTDLPVILAGGGYRHGEFRNVKEEKGRKLPLCNLYLDIAQKMGMEVDAFGTSTGTFS